MTEIGRVRDRAQRILTNALGSVRIDRDGDFVVTAESAVVFVRVSEGFGENGVLVTITCPLIKNVKVTDELCRWVAIDGQQFKIGSAQLQVGSDGTGWVLFRHHIIADDLDESELMGSLYAVLYTSDDLDNELHSRFGGELFGSE